MLNIDCLSTNRQGFQMTKEDHIRKNHWQLSPKIAVCGFVGSIYNKDTNQNKIITCAHNHRSSNKAKGWFEIVEFNKYHLHVNLIIECLHKVVNDLLRSFELDKNHEKLEERRCSS
jgi:hypothetical protein